MLSVEKLRAFGANTTEGLERCMNNEAFYLRMVTMFFQDKSFDKLKEALAKDDLEEAFKASHALKGVLANLALTSLYEIIYEVTELLRSQSRCDYSGYINRYEELYQKLLSLY